MPPEIKPLPDAGTLSPAAQKDLAALALALSDRSNPTRRKAFAALVKETAPQFAGSFDDLAADETREYVDTQLRERDHKVTQAALTRRLEREKNGLIESGRFDAESIGKLEAFMEENGYGSYEDAAVLYAHKNPAPRPGVDTPAVRGWQLPEGDWLKNPKGMARKMANEAVGEILRKRA